MNLKRRISRKGNPTRRSRSPVGILFIVIGAAMFLFSGPSLVAQANRGVQPNDHQNACTTQGSHEGTALVAHDNNGGSKDGSKDGKGGDGQGNKDGKGGDGQGNKDGHGDKTACPPPPTVRPSDTPAASLVPTPTAKPTVAPAATPTPTGSVQAVTTAAPTPTAVVKAVAAAAPMIQTPNTGVSPSFGLALAFMFLGLILVMMGRRKDHVATR